MIDNNCIMMSRYSGIALGTLTAILMSISDIFIKKARVVNALEQTTFRYLLQLVVMFVIARVNHASLLGPKEHRAGLVLRGLFGALNLISYNCCLKLLNPSDATALVYCNVVFVAILAHVYLNEKLTVVHFLSISLTLTGVYFLSKPTSEAEILGSIKHQTNSTSLSVTKPPTHNRLDTVFGIIFGLMSALFTSIVAFYLKKLNMEKVHYSVIIVYASYFGLPISLTTDFVLRLTQANQRGRRLIHYEDLFQMAYVFLGALGGVTAQITLNHALQREDTSKISIILSSDLFFVFILQYLFLDIVVNLNGVLGSMLILTGTSLLIWNKLIEKREKS